MKMYIFRTYKLTNKILVQYIKYIYQEKPLERQMCSFEMSDQLDYEGSDSSPTKSVIIPNASISWLGIITFLKVDIYICLILAMVPNVVHT